MAAQTLVLLGPARCGKTSELLGRYRKRVATASSLGGALWIAPTHRAAADVRERLLAGGLSGCLAPNCLTFSQFAEAVIKAALVPIRPLGPVEKRQILRRLVDQSAAAGKLSYFSAIAHTDGLVDQISELLADLKRQEIWPDEFRRACSRAGGTTKNRELADLYWQYQALLNSHELYDDEGRFWSARDLIAKGQSAPFGAVAFVVVDGFADFTRTQHEILALLHKRVEEMYISLPWEDGRDDLFHKSSLTLAELEKRLPGLRREVVARRGTNSPLAADDVKHIEEQLFRDPRRVETRSSQGHVEILAAAGRLGEIELLARRIKRLLLGSGASSSAAGVRPDDIIVVFRATDEAAPLIREVFAEYGIPVSMDDCLSVAQSPLIAALVAVLKLDLNDWPFRALLEVIAGNYFQPSWPEWQDVSAAIDVERAVRALQIAKGRRKLLSALERWANAEIDETAKPPRRERQRSARLAAQVLARLAAALDRLPASATPLEWAGALEDVAGELGMFDRARRPCESPIARHDLAAWQLLVDGFQASIDLDADLEGAPRKLDRRALVRRLEEICRVQKLPRDGEDAGCVRVLSAAAVRSLDAPYVFVAGLSERSFPAALRDGRVYSSAEQAEMNGYGCRFVERHERACEEMLLFYEVVTRATRQLTLSYSALDESAQPLSASPYLLEIERLFDPDSIQRCQTPNLSPVPDETEPLCPRDLRVKSMAMALAGSPRLAGRMLRHDGYRATAQALQSALTAAAGRSSGRTYHEHEGMLTGQAARQWLLGRYGQEHTWSTSQLEQYGHCPYKFFLHRVLGLNELHDLSLEVDQLLRGRRAHALLANVHRRLASRPQPCSPCDLDEDEFQRITAEELEAVMRGTAYDPGLAPIDAALDDVDHRLFAAWVASYRAQFAKYCESFAQFDSAPAPAHFEVSFGPVEGDEGDAGDPLSKPVAYELNCGGLSIRLSGRVDRIDVGLVDGQAVFNVLDYKTGKFGSFGLREIQECRKLQLPLYAMVVQDLLLADQDAIPWQAGYWHLPEKGYCAKQALNFHERTAEGVRPTEVWQLLRDAVVRYVGGLVAGIQNGQFPMYCEDEDCTGQCEYKTVCRVNAARSLEKTWQPPSAHLE